MTKLSRDVESFIENYDSYSNFIEQIIEYQEQHYDKLHVEMYWFISITRISISFLASFLDSLLLLEKKWTQSNTLQFLLIKNSIPLLFWTYDNILNWHYFFASTFNRASLENLMRVYFCSFSPDDCYWVLWPDAREDYEKQSWKKVKSFNCMKFIKNDLKNTFFENCYKFHSFETHWNMYNIIHDMEAIQKKTFEWGFIDFQWNTDIYTNIIPLLVIIYWFLTFTQEILLAKCDKSNSKWYKEFEKILEDSKPIIDFLHNILSDLSDKDWNKINRSKDIDSTILIITEKELWKQ